MKFGKEFRIHLEETLPNWRDKFLCYKPLKKLLKHIPVTADSFIADDNFHDYQRQVDAAAGDAVADMDGDLKPQDLPERSRQLMDFHEWFVRILNEELVKFNEFYMDKEEDFIIRLQELEERIKLVKEKSSKGGVFTSESEFSEEMMDIRKDFVSIHGEMVLLKNYSSLNFAGLVKILKKYDKRTGGLLRLPFTRIALHQPFFITEPLTRLVRECEANLELLFPSRAEVIESTSASQDQRNQLPDNLPATPATAAPPPTSPPSTSIGEETVDIYRSTLAAMRTIKGLRGESSTCNPLSFASLFRSQDDESTGAVTAENSVSNSSGSLERGEEADQEAVHSNK